MIEPYTDHVMNPEEITRVRQELDLQESDSELEDVVVQEPVSYTHLRKKKAFFVDGMTDHFDNFIKRMEKEGKEIILPETKEKR